MAKVKTKEEADEEEKLYTKARDLGVPGCTMLAEYMIKLEERILNLEVALTIHTGQEVERRQQNGKPKQK